MTRLLVCGGVDNDRDWIWDTLCDLDSEHGPFEVVIHGSHGNTDHEAGLWAEHMGIRVVGFRVDHERHGDLAAIKLNQRMLDEGRPDLVVAFPGGKCTRDLVSRAIKAGADVIKITDSLPSGVNP